MSRIEFMMELAALLQDVPEEERKDAIKFYNDYFDDAGEDMEAEVIAELESPGKVAGKIKADLLGQQDAGEYTETGYKGRVDLEKSVPALRGELRGGNTGERGGAYTYEGSAGERGGGYNYRGSTGERGNGDTYGGNAGEGGHTYGGNAGEGGHTYGGGTGGSGYTYEDSPEDGEKKPWSNGILKTILIIAVIICGAPIVLPLAFTIVLCMVVCVVVLFCLFFGLVIGFASLAIVGVVLVCSGFVALIPEPAIGLALVGSGLLLGVIGAIGSVASVKLCIVMIPGICRGIVWIFRRLFHRKAVEE